MKRSKHSLSYYNLLSMNQGDLIPIGLTEVLPGDSFQHATSAFIRVSPLVTPVMHPVRVRVHHWFVPHRLVWDDWEDFITGGSDGMDASVFPTRNDSNGFAVGSLGDYLGITDTGASTTVSALPFRGYNLIYNEWYRDQDLMTAASISTASGADATTSVSLRTAAWEKDYFTSARPWTQKGPEVTIPLSGDAPVKGIAVADNQTFAAAPGGNTYHESDATAVSDRLWNVFSGASAWIGAGNNTTKVPDIYADLANVNATNINDLRLALALQRYEEARARYGSRYTEYLRYLGVRSSDARLQRPEYLGGGKQTIQFSEVLQTSPTDDGDDTVGVGNLKGHGIAALRTNRYRRFFEEHGYVFTLMSVLPKTIYAQGLARTWNRRTKEDFWQKELEHIGQQEVLNKEVYLSHATPEGVFGYQDRYDEYRRSESRVSGEFRTTLDDWHMARIFASDPALNSTFVTANPTDRIYASTATDQLYVMANHSIQARRMVARTGSSFTF